MNLPLTYGQCLRKIMHGHRLSINDLSRKMGYRSTTQLARILNDEVSSTLVTKFHRQLILIFDWLFTPAEIKALCTSWQFTCLGEEAFLTRSAMRRMLFETPQLTAVDVPLHVYPPMPGYASLQDLFRAANQYEQIDLIILGSSFDAQLPLYAKLIAQREKANSIRIRHCFVMEENHAQIVSQICALQPYLNTDAYEGYYCTRNAEDAYRFLQQNPIAIARSVDKDGVPVTTVFTPKQKDGVSACTLEGSDVLFAFYESLLEKYKDHLLPIKSVYEQPKTVQSLLTLCQRDLFLEQNRACWFIRLDLCFHALPTKVVLQAVDHGARLGMSPDEPLMQQMCRVHEARYRNLLDKEAPTCLILTRDGLTAFAKTGHMSDHLFAMRDLTVQERIAVLEPLIAASQGSLCIHLLADNAYRPVSAFAAYQDMGMQISDNHTAYNPKEAHSEVFIGQPEFAASFGRYCTDVLIPEYCLDRAQSLAFLASLLDMLRAMPESDEEARA